MKAENIQSNVTAEELAGGNFAKFEQDQDKLVVEKLLEYAKGIHTIEDVNNFLKGYAESLSGSDGSKRSRKSMVKTILCTLTATDKKLSEYHKLSNPADGQKLVKAKMKNAKGINSLASALRVPSAGKAEGDSEGEGESEPETETGYVNKADEWWDACVKLGHSDKFGLTTDEMMARIAEIIAQ
jgi:hypothetical protein